MTKPLDPATLDDAAAAPAPADTAGLLDFAPVPVMQSCAGWSARRQRIFIKALAETGSVTEAAETAGVNPRSAYRLRLRPDAAAFRAAWAQAQRVAVDTLTSIAFERAINGSPRYIIHKGRAMEVHVPSDRLLMFLLRHLDSKRYGNLSGLLPVNVPDPVEEASAAFTPVAYPAAGEGGLVDLEVGPNADSTESFSVQWFEAPAGQATQGLPPRKR